MTEMIAHLKDQLQEMKSKSNLESKYVKKSAENSLDMNSTLKNIEETDLKVGKTNSKSSEILENFLKIRIFDTFCRKNLNKWKKKLKWKIVRILTLSIFSTKSENIWAKKVLF